MTETTIALVTGATRGIGFTTVRRLADLGWTVLLGARDERAGKDAAASLAGDVRPIMLEVTDDGSVAAAVAQVEEQQGRLDVLINNAGITGPHHGAAETSADDLAVAYATNVFGPVRVTRAFLPLLRRSGAPRIVMVSSGIGSHAVLEAGIYGDAGTFGLGYPSSKAALNMIGAQYARALPEMRVNVVDPGYTATDFNAHSGPQTVEEGTDAIVAMAQVPPDGPTATFVDRHGTVGW